VKYVGSVELPVHRGEGGFDHAAIHRGRGLLYLAHTANDAVDVIDTREGRYVRSIEGLQGVAGALVAEEQDRVFTSNRGENTVGIFSPPSEADVARIPVGARPNGLAYDPDRGILLCANVGDPTAAQPPSVTFVDVAAGRALETIPMPGRTRWAVFDRDQRVFFVNIADPFQVAILDPVASDPVVRFLDVPARGPHGLELDASGHRLLCACDEGKLVSVDSRSGQILGTLDLTGTPDVVFLNHSLGRLYVAIGDPGVIDVIDVAGWRTAEVVPTERGTHTIALDEDANRVYAFMPQTHRAAMFEDHG
jgi:DNA-binding beta-propeller fold protein YncE